MVINENLLVISDGNLPQMVICYTLLLKPWP